jgi:CBS domain-containing protein
MKLTEIMTKPPITVREDVPIDEVAARMIGHRIGCLPVVGAAGDLLGIVTARDFGAKDGHCPFPPFCGPGFPGDTTRPASPHQIAGPTALAPRTVRQIMTPRPITLDEGATVVEAIAKMLHLGFDHIPVVREGVLVGIVARVDLLRLTLRLLSDSPGPAHRESADAGPSLRPPVDEERNRVRREPAASKGGAPLRTLLGRDPRHEDVEESGGGRHASLARGGLRDREDPEGYPNAPSCRLRLPRL